MCALMCAPHPALEACLVSPVRRFNSLSLCVPCRVGLITAAVTVGITRHVNKKPGRAAGLSYVHRKQEPLQQLSFLFIAVSLIRNIRGDRKLRRSSGHKHRPWGHSDSVSPTQALEPQALDTCHVLTLPQGPQPEHWTSGQRTVSWGPFCASQDANSIPGPHPPDAKSTPPSYDNQNISIHCQMSPGDKVVPIKNHCFTWINSCNCHSAY